MLADNAAEVDSIAWKRGNDERNRVIELLDNPAERDPDLWEDAFAAVGIDPEWAVYSQYDLVASFAVSERDLTWQMARATIEAAARTQAALELTVRDVLTASEQHAAKIARVSTADVKAVAKTGIGKDRIDAALERRKGDGDGNQKRTGVETT